MTNPRSDIVDPNRSGVYHCISRCVRRAFLCGYDSYSSKSFDHRKLWVKARLSELLNIFAIRCLAYAIMSSHLHSLLLTSPELASTWTDVEVAKRWRLLFPKRRLRDGTPLPATPLEIEEITSQPALVTLYRKRLSDISWFNRCLNEAIARRANAEDDCTGRFWEGRFKCQRVVGDAAILACSVYIDLNPIRAGIALTPEESNFTSIQERIKVITTNHDLSKSSPPLIAHEEYLHISEGNYIKLVDETGRNMVKGKHNISPDLAPIFERLNISLEAWIHTSQSLNRLFRRVVGSEKSLRSLARQRGKAWFQGLSSAKRVFASA